MMMRCRPYVLGTTLVLGLACLAGVAQAGSGYVPAPQAIHGPIASEQAIPSAQWDGGCAPCGPVVETGCHGGGKKLFGGMGGCFSGLKCKLQGAGHGLKCKVNDLGCGIRGGLHGMKGKFGGCFKHKRVECAPVCEPACAPCGDVWPSGQGAYAAPQDYAAPQGYAAPQAGSAQH
jgi:hypothetical protein